MYVYRSAAAICDLIFIQICTYVNTHVYHLLLHVAKSIKRNFNIQSEDFNAIQVKVHVFFLNLDGAFYFQMIRMISYQVK